MMGIPIGIGLAGVVLLVAALRIFNTHEANILRWAEGPARVVGWGIGLVVSGLALNEFSDLPSTQKLLVVLIGVVVWGFSSLQNTLTERR